MTQQSDEASLTGNPVPSPSRTMASLHVCLLTPPGRGAVATIGARGRLTAIDTCFRPVSHCRIDEMETGRIYFGHWGTSAPYEEVVVVRTSITTAEIHCHGGTAAVERLLQDLADAQACILSPEDWQAAHETTFFEQLQRECETALTRGLTQKTAHHLLRQCTLFPREVIAIQHLTSDALKSERIRSMLHWAPFGLHLTQPWKIVLCGRPNVGKSSLINALVGYTRSIVYDQPGTTRDVVAVESAFDGWPVELSDTAGIRELPLSNTADDHLELEGIARTRLRLQEADLIVLVLDAAAESLPEDNRLLTLFPQAIVVQNKSDLAAGKSVSEVRHPGAISCSARTGEGLSDLISAIVTRLVPREPGREVPFPVTQRQEGWLKGWLEELNRHVAESSAGQG